MPKFILKSKINSILKNTGKPPIAEIIFLGTGGAFDLAEKNSSAIIKTAGGTVLVDCGYTVYQELRAKNLVDSIDCVFITHCHEDHIGSLSTLIYHNFFISKKEALHIECVPSLKPRIETYLMDVCGHSEESFVINANEGNLYEKLNFIVHKIDTTGLHYEDFPSGGFVFNFRKSGENLFIIYSGDINTPITDVISENDAELYDSLLKKPDNVFVFHESTARDYPPHYPHCDYKKLEKTAEVFPNIYLFHHGIEETKLVSKEFKNLNLKYDALKIAIDKDLNKKLSLVKKYGTKEKIRIQAKRLKNELYEELGAATQRTQDLNTLGIELVIQEEMGL